MAAEKLFTEFPGTSSEAWREKIEMDLKGADFNKRLVWRTDEGFDVQPYYRQEDLNELNPTEIDTHKDWLIRQDYASKKSPEEWNPVIKKAIELGIQSLGLNMKGLKSIDAASIKKILSGIQVEDIELNFYELENPVETFSALLEYLQTNHLKPSALRGSLGIDPLGMLSANGEYDEAALAQLATLIKENDKLPSLKLLSIDAGLLQNGGSTLSQELGFGLAMANEYIAKLEELGCSPEAVINTITFSFVTGPNYFMEIAKLRAARKLWEVICTEWGVKDSPTMIIYSRSASWNLTVYDANVNMLRTTTEAMSASLGGSDSISVVPYDSSFREENDFSLRIAKNTQIILKDEAHLNKVADPSAGSYYIEQLTDKLAEQAWKHFLEVEDKNGFLNAFKTGFMQAQVALSAENKRNLAASRRSSILGVNQYPNFSEMILEKGLTLPVNPAKENTTYEALTPFSVSEEFEQLRLQTEKNGKRPKVFLLKYGEPTWMTARAMFASNFFACAGYEIMDNSGFKKVEEGIAAAKKARADIVVLCSADADYPEIAPLIFNEMNSSAEIVIAGYPKDSIEALQKQGLKHFIHVKSNLLEVLKEFQDILKNKK
ncbi:MAG: methylmalonyl-CoA mutase family protein [Bacteroidales bacterium]|jgi:methylmalonyl-CoA mutase|nr:methylmalonyl-CoA mutase family protein [Bacteroidales bacterium]